MKVTNFLLFAIAGIFVFIVVKISNVVGVGVPTSVLTVPASDSAVGGDFSLKLPDNFTEKQSALLHMAYNIAKNDGHKYPQILQGIILQESHAGNLKSYKVAGQEFGLKTNERYYGVAQIKLSAAKDVINRYPQVRDNFNFHTKTDEEIIAKLIENDEFNLTIASKYLLVLKSMGYDTAKQLALAYNQGPTGARRYDEETHKYSVKVMRHMQQLSDR